ncbi:MAG: HD domain-containing protein [Acidobacteriaceae bacterium]|nr:HD domain-containing protein [Acidobacteriaceae bacterium]
MVLGALGIRRGVVAEFDSRAAALRPVASWGIEGVQSLSLSLDAADSEALLQNGQPGISLIEGEAETTANQLSEDFKKLLKTLRGELVVALIVRSELVGLILLGSKASEEPFTTEDRQTVGAMARHIGVGIHNHRLLREIEERAAENRRLYEELRAIYYNTVRAFATAIDIKDKYTQGHSERVGKYSEIIAREMGWSEEEAEGLAIAGYLHDIGKLVVERDIINAPYKIDAKHSAELNRHPIAGYEILAPIRHPFADIPLMARYHHERVDGGGYPDGLSGSQIPIGAKIVTLADSFDAMTTDRPYRRRRGLEEVIEEFRNNAGKQFEPEVIAAFCRALLKEINGKTRDKRILKLLGKGYVQTERIKPLLAGLIAELETAALTST